MGAALPERVLVLAIDIDNDLYRKTRLSGPVIGRESNLSAAAALALADPQDTDANTMFEAVRKYDELKKLGYPVHVVTITGSESEGYIADAEFARQLDIVMERFKPDSCVLVTDGASDNRVIPIIKSRVDINSVDLLRMKQAEALENTYFTLLEKLKEPHYARIVFGIPAAILLLFAVSYYFHFGWQLPVALIGIYLIIKGLGLEESLIKSFAGFGFSIERLSFLFYVGSIIFFVISIILSYGDYAAGSALTSNSLTLAAYAIEGLIILLPVSLSLYLIGRMIDLQSSGMKYRAIKQSTYIGYTIIVLALVYITAAWIIGQIYFYQLLLYDIIAIIIGYALAKFGSALRRRAIRSAKMKGKKVISDIGAYIGMVTKVQASNGKLYVKTGYGNVISYDADRIVSISDRIIIR